MSATGLDPAVLTWADLTAAWTVDLAFKRHALAMRIRVDLENAGLMPHPPSGIPDATLAP